MNRALYIYIFLIVVTVGLIIAVDASRPRPVDWTPNYSVKDKIPLGLYVFGHELENIFKPDSIERIRVTPYEYFDSRFDPENKRYNVTGSFIHISEGGTLDKESAQELLYFAAEGNTIMLSMPSFPKVLQDSLHVETDERFGLKDSVTVTLPYSKTARERNYVFTEAAGNSPFVKADTARTAILGYQHTAEEKAEKEVNFIKVPYGKGSFLLHTQPAAFSNYYLLKETHSPYATALLSYLPKGKVYFYSERYSNSVSGSPLRYIWSQPALAAAAWISILGIGIFILFNARRKQRIIPIIPPVRNTTIEFTRTIGNLYYQEGSHHAIIDKMIVYFLEKVRTEYLLDTFSLDGDFAEKLHLKTNAGRDDIEKLLMLIRQHRNRFDSTEADVIALNNAIEKLKI
jgi:hypothetical protein